MNGVSCKLGSGSGINQRLRLVDVAPGGSASLLRSQCERLAARQSGSAHDKGAVTRESLARSR